MQLSDLNSWSKTGIQYLVFCLSLDIENSVYSKIIDLHGICLLRILLRFYASFQIEYGLKTQLYVKLEV